MTPLLWVSGAVVLALIACITVLVALHDTVPSVFPEALIGVLVGHFALQLPGQTTGNPPA